jgi:Cu/Ag efflux pump CusA
MWIVKIALKAPYTFAVLAILLMIGGALSALQMPKDIFPAINIPVVGVIWTFNGMPAQEMERRITTVSERALTTTVNNIEHIESNSFNGIDVIKVYLQRREIFRARTLRLYYQFYSYAARDRTGFIHSPALWRQNQSCIGRPGSQQAAGP